MMNLWMLYHGPAGLNIGSETPQEIAISIVSEILAFTRKQSPISLSEKVGAFILSKTYSCQMKL